MRKSEDSQARLFSLSLRRSKLMIKEYDAEMNMYRIDIPNNEGASSIVDE